MRKFLFSFMVLGLLAAAPSETFAQKAVSDAGAAELRRVVDETLKFERDVAAQTGSGLKLGEPQITNKGSYYEVRLPDVRYSYADLGEIDIGTVVFNVTHGKTDDEYLASMAVQPTVSFKAANGDKLVLHIGKQKFAMAWQATLQYPTRVDAEYGDLKLRSEGGEAFSAHVENVRVIGNLQSNGDGTWTGPIETELTNVTAELSATPHSGGGNIRLARFYNKTDYDRFDLALVLQSRKQVQQLVKDADGKPVEDAEGLLKAMVQDGLTIFNGAKTEVLVQNFSIDVAPLPPQEGQTPELPRSLRLAEMSSKVDMTGLRTDKGNISARVSIKDLVANNMVDPEAEGYLPQNGNFELYLDDMPLQSLYKTFAGLMVQGLRAARMAEDAAQRGQPHNMKRQQESQIYAAAMAIPQMLTGAGSTVNIRNTFIRSRDLSTRLFGSFRAEPGAVKVGVGEMTLVIQGLDELIRKLETANTRQSRRALQGLSFLQMLGQQDTEDGKPIRRYVFAMAQDGRMTLNGSEIGGLIGGLPQ